jgi:hypothetical protein
MLNDFIAEVKQGALARNNRYAVFFDSPIVADPFLIRKTILFCDQVQIPGINLSTVQNRTFGEFRETPYEKLFDTMNMSFYVDSDMQVKLLFDNWMASIQDPITRTFSYYDQYTTDITIQVQDINDRSKYQLTLYECYPKTVGSIQLDYANKEVMKLTINMQYKYWISESVHSLEDDQVISTELIDSFIDDFDGFQDSLNGGESNLFNI